MRTDSVCPARLAAFVLMLIAASFLAPVAWCEGGKSGTAPEAKAGNTPETKTEVPQGPKLRESLVSEALKHKGDEVMIKGDTGVAVPDPSPNTVVYSLQDMHGNVIRVRTEKGLPALSYTYVVRGIVQQGVGGAEPVLVEHERYRPPNERPRGKSEPPWYYLAGLPPGAIVDPPISKPQQLPDPGKGDDEGKREPGSKGKETFWTPWHIAIVSAGAFLIVLAILLAVVATRRQKEAQRIAQQEAATAERQRQAESARQQMLASPEVPAGRTQLAESTGHEAPHVGTLMTWGQLEFTSGPLAGQKFPLYGMEAVIGRENGDIQIPADQSLSATHGRIQHLSDGRVVFTDESTNGSVVNGKPVHRDKVELASGARLQIGISEAVLSLPVGRGTSASPPPAASPSSTPTMQFQSPVGAPMKPSAAATQMFLGAELAVTKGPDAGRRAPISNTAFTIGRAEDCDLVLTDPTVSRKQATITFADGVFTLRSEGTAGTIVNGTKSDTAVLDAGAQVQMGGTTIVLNRLT